MEDTTYYTAVKLADGETLLIGPETMADAADFGFALSETDATIEWNLEPWPC